MARQSNSLEWFKKAEIDYFAAFIKLWLSFNALYKRLFQNYNIGRKDRDYIEYLKKQDNVLKRKFNKLFEDESDEGREFRLYLMEFIKIFDGGFFGGKTIKKNEVIRPHIDSSPVDEINFKDFIHPRNFQLSRKPKGYIKIGKFYIREEPDKIWPYFVEVLYMVRNQLIHGELEPSDSNHKTLKVCYSVLNLLIKDEV